MIEQQRSLKRLLVLDDENDVAATICMMATTAGYETEYTDDIDFFIERLLVWSPTHVAVDLQLANRDGIEVIHRLVELDCKAAVMIISGLGGRILASASRAATENGLRFIGSLSKPFTRATFLALLAVDTSRTLSEQESSFITSQLSASGDQLANALRAKAFIAHFQPKISCFNGELVGFECLARWPQPGTGMIAPDVFIGIAEQSGLIHQLTRQIYDYALANIADLARVETKLKFALNLSPINLNDETFPVWLLDKCKEHSVAPTQIILEVTETASMDNPLKLLERLTQFRIRGFHLSIDDFGVGYSSLVQLARLPFSELKIDQMFIKTLSTSEESRQIVTAVVGLGKAMGLNVVAEGVEDEWALNYLRNKGCDEAQGYFIARPMDKVAAIAWNGCSWRIET